jgi:hypothetical protein
MAGIKMMTLMSAIIINIQRRPASTMLRKVVAANTTIIKNKEQADTARPTCLGNGRSTPVTTNKSPTNKQKATTGGGIVGRTANSNSDHQDGGDDFGDDAEEEDFLDEPATSKDVNIGVPPPSRRLEVELSNYITSLSHHHHHHMAPLPPSWRRNTIRLKKRWY